MRPRAPTSPDPATDPASRVQAEIERLLGGPLDDKRMRTLGRALGALHALFTSEMPPDDPFPDYAADKASLAAYLAWFFPASVQQVGRALAETALPAPGPLRVLDVGSGAGPASFAVAARAVAAGARPETTALDHSPTALDALRRLWDDALGPLQTRRWRAADALPDGPFDLVVASHLFNEAFNGDPARLALRVKLARALADRLAPGGRLLVVEPALRRTGRELLVLRDRLLDTGLVALAPCLFQGACPAIKRPRDWCHADRPWTPPPLSERAGQVAGVGRDSLKFTYVVLARSHPEPERTRDQSLFRIVSEPLPEKGKLRYFGCGPAGRHALVRLEREATAANAPFATLERGDVVRIGATALSGDGRRIGADTTVQVEIAARDRDLPGPG